MHGVALISMAALGAVRVRDKVRRSVARTVGGLLGYDPDAQEDLARTAQQRATDLTDRTGEDAVQFTARVIGSNVHLLLGLIRANRPWRLAVTLS